MTTELELTPSHGCRMGTMSLRKTSMNVHALNWSPVMCAAIRPLLEITAIAVSRGP